VWRHLDKGIQASCEGLLREKVWPIWGTTRNVLDMNCFPEALQ
jgi:hypothetical protein